MQNQNLRHSPIFSPAPYYFLLLTSLLLTLTSCGGDGDGGQSVQRLRFLADDIEVGESVRVETEFESGNSDFSDVRATTLIYEISSALSLEENSFRLFEGSDDDTDFVFPESILKCADGRTLVRLYLSRDDLRGNEDSGSFKLKFNVIGARSSAVATVSGAAGSGREISCESDFLAQESDAVEIL